MLVYKEPDGNWYFINDVFSMYVEGPFKTKKEAQEASDKITETLEQCVIKYMKSKKT